MASDTAPAAVPGPHNDPATPTSPPATGGLTGMLTPVEPARSATFNLDPQTTAHETAGHETAAEGTSSTAYHQPDQEENTKNSAGKASRQERSVVRAWLLAGAKRWEKGADARNKRLDIKKARAQARQVKETITVNRSEKTGSGATNSHSSGNSGSGKSLTSKSNKSPSGKAPKNTSGGSGNDSSGRSGGTSGGGRETSGGGAGRDTVKPTSSKTGPDAKPSKGDRGASGHRNAGSAGGSGTPGGKTNTGSGGSGAGTGKDADSSSGHKPGKDTSSRTGGGGAQGGKTGPQGAAGKPGKDAPTPSGNTDSSKPDETGLDEAKKPTAKGGGEGTRQAGPDAKPSTTAPGSDHTAHKDPAKDGKDSNATDSSAKNDKDGKGSKGDEADKKAKNPEKHSGNEDRTDSNNPKPTTAQTPVPAPRTRIDTQASREAGYRDGTRVGKAVAHTQAYRQGYRDGRTDTAQAAATEKARLDKAREDRKNPRPQPEDKPVTQPASSADYQPPTPPKPIQTVGTAPGNHQPIEVTGTDATHIHLGQGADRPSISRGEVRTLRGFQQRLDVKADVMTRVTEATRVLEQHANEQNKQITQLLEQAQSVKGGDKLVAALTRLQDDAQLQATKAAEINKRATYAADYAKSLQTSTQTRYGDIYNAVQDAGDLANMSYYREMSNV
ncbi:hypothetical protein [Streptomyces sp. PU_AKi4]|uniref:hypothetical protein n=1 Tax=Streptomyces sp. PU_AKi4 TaxID=2800809 RepID=UPI003523305A